MDSSKQALKRGGAVRKAKHPNDANSNLKTNEDTDTKDPCGNEKPKQFISEDERNSNVEKTITILYPSLEDEISSVSQLLTNEQPEADMVVDSKGKSESSDSDSIEIDTDLETKNNESEKCAETGYHDVAQNTTEGAIGRESKDTRATEGSVIQGHSVQEDDFTHDQVQGGENKAMQEGVKSTSETNLSRGNEDCTLSETCEQENGLVAEEEERCTERHLGNNGVDDGNDSNNTCEANNSYYKGKNKIHLDFHTATREQIRSQVAVNGRSLNVEEHSRLLICDEGGYAPESEEKTQSETVKEFDNMADRRRKRDMFKKMFSDKALNNKPNKVTVAKQRSKSLENISNSNENLKSEDLHVLHQICVTSPTSETKSNTLERKSVSQGNLAHYFADAEHSINSQETSSKFAKNLLLLPIIASANSVESLLNDEDKSKVPSLYPNLLKITNEEPTTEGDAFFLETSKSQECQPLGSENGSMAALFQRLTKGAILMKERIEALPTPKEKLSSFLVEVC